MEIDAKIVVDNLLIVFEMFGATDYTEPRRLELSSDLVVEYGGSRSFENSHGKQYHDCSFKLKIESLQAATRAAEWLFTNLSNKSAKLSIETGEVKLDKGEIERVLERKYAIHMAPLLKESFSETYHRISRKRSVHRKSLRRGWLWLIAFFVLGALYLTPSFTEWLKSLISIPTIYTSSILGLSAFGTMLLTIRQFAVTQRLDLAPEEQMFAKLYELLPDLSEYAKTRGNEALLHIYNSLREITKSVGQRPESWMTGPLMLAKEELAKPLESFWKNLSEHLLPFFEEGNEYYLAHAVETFRSLLSYLDSPSLNALSAFNDVASKLPEKARAPTFDWLSILSWGRSRQARLFALLELAFSVVLVIGFYLVSIWQGQSLVSYAHLMFVAWFAATATILVGTCLRRI